MFRFVLSAHKVPENSPNIWAVEIAMWNPSLTEKQILTDYELETTDDGVDRVVKDKTVFNLRDSKLWEPSSNELLPGI